MAIMKIIELRQKNTDELQTLLEEKRIKLEELKFLASQRKIKNVKEVSLLRKDIARIATLLKEK